MPGCRRRSRLRLRGPFQEGPDQNVGDDAGAAQKAAAAGSKDAQSVRLVDDQDAVGGGGLVRESGQGRRVAVHAEEGLGDEEPASKAGTGAAAGRRLEHRRGGKIAIRARASRNHRPRLAWVEFVGDDQVIAAGEGVSNAPMFVW